MLILRIAMILIVLSTTGLAQFDNLSEQTLKQIEIDGSEQAKLAYEIEKQSLAQQIASKRSSTTALRRQLRELEKRGPSKTWEVPSTEIPRPKLFGRLSDIRIENLEISLAYGKKSLTLIQKLNSAEGIIQYSISSKTENESRELYINGLSLEGIQEGDSVAGLVMGKVYFFKDYAYETVIGAPRTIQGLWYAGNSLDQIERTMLARTGTAPNVMSDQGKTVKSGIEFGSAYRGSAGREGEKLVINKASAVSVPLEVPKEGYVFEVEFSKSQDAAIFVIPVGQRNVQVVIDGEYGKYTALSNVGKSAMGGMTGTKVGPTVVQSTLRVEVTIRSELAATITADLNNTKVIKWAGKISDLNTPREWVPPDRSKIGLGAADTSVIVSSYSIAPISKSGN